LHKEGAGAFSESVAACGGEGGKLVVGGPCFRVVGGYVGDCLQPPSRGIDMVEIRDLLQKQFPEWKHIHPVFVFLFIICYDGLFFCSSGALQSCKVFLFDTLLVL